ncbi:hypothetical protein FQA39_LY04916 [Lamprigera yunnana]|nr:hypothetical protein FQA39_LY04916 [Lamprigera yunnana]
MNSNRVNDGKCENMKAFYISSDSDKLFNKLCVKGSKNNKHEGFLDVDMPCSPLEDDCRKKRCADRYDSSESSDSGVAVLSCTDCSGSSTASSDITDPGSPFSTASSHSEDSSSQPAKMPPTQSAHHGATWREYEDKPLAELKMRVLNFFFIVLVLHKTACDCNIKNFNVIAITQKGDNYKVTVNSCIEQRLFGNDKIRGLYAKDQRLNNLSGGSIDNMNELEAISFHNCSIETLERGAFNDVPQLSNIFLMQSFIKEVRYGVFNNVPSLTKLRLNNNRIETVEDNAFSNIRRLKKVYMGHNKLKIWNKEWFVNSSSIEKINFEFNFVAKIQSLAFEYLPKISSINFNYNNIAVIEPNAFLGIRHLNYLGLRYNKITALESNIVPKHLSVNSLFIDANKLNYIPEKMLQKLTIKNLTIDGNPWNCPCLEKIGSWLNSTNGKVKSSKHCRNSNVLQCIHLDLLNSKCVEVVDAEMTSVFVNAFKNRHSPNNIKQYQYCVRI